MESLSNLGLLIKKKRKELGYSTKDLANALNVSTGFLNNIENANTDTFNINLMKKFDNILNLNIPNYINKEYLNNNETALYSIGLSPSNNKKLMNLLSLITNLYFSNNFSDETIANLIDKLSYEINYTIKLKDH